MLGNCTALNISSAKVARRFNTPKVFRRAKWMPEQMFRFRRNFISLGVAQARMIEPCI